MTLNLSAGLFRKEIKMETRKEALEQIRYLMKKYSISLNEIRTTEKFPATEEKGSTIKRFFAFLGGLFVLSGISIYIGQHWVAMNSLSRVVITLGTGIAFFIFAVTASYDKRYEKILAPFFLLAALFETIGMFVTIHEYFAYGKDWHLAALLVFGTLLIQQVITFVKYNRSSLLFLSIAFGALFFANLFDYMHASENYSQITIGLSLVLICYGINETHHRSITPFWYLLGSALFYFGFFSIVQGKIYEPLFLAAAIFGIYLSTFARSRMLLFTGAIALISYIGYFTNKYFTVSIGWPLSLIIFGILLLGISVITLRIGRKIK